MHKFFKTEPNSHYIKCIYFTLYNVHCDADLIQ